MAGSTMEWNGAASKSMPRGKLFFQEHISKSMPVLVAKSELDADDDFVMAHRFSRRCERPAGDSSPLPAPTRFRKAQTGMNEEQSHLCGLRRSQSQPTLYLSQTDKERFDGTQHEVIMMALKMVNVSVYLSF
jgi:hypothetical protein